MYIVDEGTANICKNSKFHNGILSYIPIHNSFYAFTAKVVPEGWAVTATITA